MPEKLQSKAWSCGTLEAGFQHLANMANPVKEEDNEELERELQDGTCSLLPRHVSVCVCVFHVFFSSDPCDTGTEKAA